MSSVTSNNFIVLVQKVRQLTLSLFGLASTQNVVRTCILGQYMHSCTHAYNVVSTATIACLLKLFHVSPQTCGPIFQTGLSHLCSKNIQTALEKLLICNVTKEKMAQPPRQIGSYGQDFTTQSNSKQIMEANMTDRQTDIHTTSFSDISDNRSTAVQHHLLHGIHRHTLAETKNYKQLTQLEIHFMLGQVHYIVMLKGLELLMEPHLIATGCHLPYGTTKMLPATRHK